MRGLDVFDPMFNEHYKAKGFTVTLRLVHDRDLCNLRVAHDQTSAAVTVTLPGEVAERALAESWAVNDGPTERLFAVADEAIRTLKAVCL